MNDVTTPHAQTPADPATWTLTHENGARLRVAARGATLLSWEVPEDSGFADLLDGYRTVEELETYNGYRNAVLAPWSNRITDARYRYGDEVHDVEPGQTGARDGLHGLVTDATFDADAAPGETGPSLTLRTAITPQRNPGYPFTVDVAVTYTLVAGPDGEHALTFEMTGTNASEQDAPIGLGWHPYFRLPGHERIDELHLTIPARTRVLTDEGIIPLPGDAAFEPVDPPGAVGLSPIGQTVLDQAFTDLVPDPDGNIASVLSSPRTGARLTLWQRVDEARIVHVFTGDTLDRDRRASAAVEPCSFGADALNRQLEDMLVPPGGTRHLRADVVYQRS